jgi:site-specific DNA recombinase
MALELKPTRKPALYARFSSDIQNPASVTDQLSRLRAHLERNGDDPTEALTFSDSAISGSVWRARPGVQALMAAVKRREVSYVYAEDVDRISRDPGDLSEFKKQLHHYGVGFMSVSEGLRLDGSVGSALAFMVKSFTAEQSVKATADKSQRGLRSNFEQKKTTGGRTYGYERVKIDESKKGTAIRENRTSHGSIFPSWVQGRSLIETPRHSGNSPPRLP